MTKMEYFELSSGAVGRCEISTKTGLVTMPIELYKQLKKGYQEAVVLRGKVQDLEFQEPQGNQTMEDYNPVIREALSGARGPDQMKIAEHGLDWIEKILHKNWDYGSSVWKNPTLVPDMSPREAILVRMSDKVARIQEMANKDGEVDESLEDTIGDLGAYCFLWVLADGLGVADVLRIT